MRQTKAEAIAIIGIGCRFPGGVNNPQKFWHLLRNGQNAVTEVPTDRWNIDDYYDPDPDVPGKMNTRHGGFLDQIDQFDPQFFNISPREAVSLDPQQRLLLEIAWEAIEHANIPPEQLRNSLTGVFIGISGFEYALYSVNTNNPEQVDAYYGTGNTLSVASGRISYTLGLTGPSLSVDTACSSSLTALHLACQSLQHRECDAALAGGINLIIAPATTIGFSKARMMAADGRCKTFDADADGYVRGEGCGMVVLKRLPDAIANQDHILAVIRGSAMNQDGPSSGLTVPSIPAQEAAIRQALANAGVDSAQISYVETHGTGTPVGDPVEARALGAVFGPYRPPNQPLYVGSVKTNIGHLETASGMAGLIKLILALQYQEIPANLHFKQPSPHIPWAEIPLQVVTEHRAWPANGKRVAGLSGFGFSGTNVHFVLEEAPTTDGLKPDTLPKRPLQLLTLSAKTEAALVELAGRYKNLLTAQPKLNLPDVCFTANTGRSHFRHRLGLIVDSTEQTAEKLERFVKGQQDTSMWQGFIENEDRPKIAFLFTGQGAQYVGMGHQLYETQPVFQQSINNCDKILQDYLPQSLLAVLYSQPETASPIDETAYTQPALFALEYALAQLWQSWGITPDVVIGHSIGEYVAACIAGVFSLADGLKLVAERGRLMQNLPPNGAMVVVFADETRVNAAIEPHREVISIAAFNGPEQIVISGDQQALEKVVDVLEKDAIKTQRLTVSHAFHSPLMEPMLTEFGHVASSITFSPPQIELISNVTGQVATDEVQTPDYWIRHVRQPVRFSQGIRALHAQNCAVYIELGPKPILLGMARQTLPDSDGIWLPSLRQGRDDWQQMLAALAALYTHGAAVNWTDFDKDYIHHRSHLTLPTYPFQRQRFWAEATAPTLRSQDYLQDNQNEISHPLLGRRIHSAALQPHQYQFESRINHQSPAFLTDHRIFQTALLPATAYLEMALAAGQVAFNSDNLTLRDVALQQVLILPEDGLKTVQVILTPENPKTYIFQIYSLTTSDNNPAWTQHATGKIVLKESQVDEFLADLEGWPQTHGLKEITVETCFQQSLARGFNFGPGFQLIKQVWQGDDEALGHTQLPSKNLADASQYITHPALLDACFQVLEATFTDENTSDIYLPTGLERLTVLGHPETQLWSYVQVRPIPSAAEKLDTKLADLQLFNEHGAAVIEIKGLQLKKIGQDVLRRLFQQDISSWLYRVAWIEKEVIRQPSPLPTQTKGSWLIFADETGVGLQLAVLLAEHNQRPVLVWPGETYAPANEPDQYYLNPAKPEQFQQLLTDSLTKEQPAYHGIIHLWGLQQTVTENIDTLQSAQELGTQSVLHLTQAVVQSRWPQPPRLWLVTRGAQPVGAEAIPLQVTQTPLWGLGRVIAFEHPELHCVRLDLDPLENTDEGQRLFEILWHIDPEDQIAFRRGKRYVARLVQYDSRIQADELDIPKKPFRLTMSDYGILENLILKPIKRLPPAADEVEIRVRATGLNFRDVLNALGMLQEFAAELGFNSADEVPFGGECAGEVVAIGQNVTNFNIGDEVIAAMAIGSLSSHATVNTTFVIPKPREVSFTEAATLTTTFLTAAYGLTHLAKIQPGDRVLIHAAAGGVGQAAVQIAQQAGAEIFATASPGKWEFLRGMGIKHVMNSRTVDFADEVIHLTQGRGVNIVLNSLNGEFISKSLETLAPQGRFIEIGKINIWTESQMKAVRPDVAYHAFDLLEVAQQDPGLIKKLLGEMSRQLQIGQLKPLPHQVFFIENTVHAFRHMAQAKHIGKVVIAQPKQISDNEALVQENGSYLITGGLGELGLMVAGWLAEQGAQHLILIGRKGIASESAQKAVTKLTETGAKVEIIQADVSNPADVTRWLENITKTMPPLRGIIHAAGILDDGILLQQTWPRFVQVMAPKVAGTWNLHTLTQHLPLDFFVCFSSMAALLGSPGQSNYAAANTFMDELMHHRRRLGLPGLSINWGPWAKVGMLAKLSEHDQARLTAQGITTIARAQGMQAMELLFRQNTPQIGVLNIDWSNFLTQFSSIPASPYIEAFTQLIEMRTPQKSSELLQELKTTPLNERPNVLIAYLRTQLVRVLGLSSPEQIEPGQRFFELGLDSLMAIELKNHFENSLGQSLPATALFDHPTVETLAHYLARQVELSEDTLPALDKPDTVSMPLSANALPANALSADVPSSEDVPSDDDVDATIAITSTGVEQLSEAEAEALLLKELEKLNF